MASVPKRVAAVATLAFERQHSFVNVIAMLTITEVQRPLNAIDTALAEASEFERPRTYSLETQIFFDLVSCPINSES